MSYDDERPLGRRSPYPHGMEKCAECGALGDLSAGLCEDCFDPRSETERWQDNINSIINERMR